MKFTRVLIALFAAASALVASAVTHDAPAYWQALEAFNKNDIRTAYNLFSGVVQEDPEHGEAWLYKGVIEDKWKKYDDVINSMSHAIVELSRSERKVDYSADKKMDRLAKDPRELRFMAYNLRAYAYKMKNDTVKELEDIDQALRLNRRAVNPYLMRADVNMARGQYYDAEKDLTTVLKHDKKNTQAMFNLARVAYERKQYDKAIEMCNKTIALAPGNAAAYSLRGYSYAHLENYKDAGESFLKSYSLKASPDIMREMARCDYAQQNYPAALAHVEVALRNKPSDKAAAALKADILKAMEAAKQ